MNPPSNDNFFDVIKIAASIAALSGTIYYIWNGRKIFKQWIEKDQISYQIAFNEYKNPENFYLRNTKKVKVLK